ncbi:MAG: hypothetical protein HFE86_03525 [Clostridiales bacterium]|nr:hypothetical protein [Clostridiales bacterium]
MKRSMLYLAVILILGLSACTPSSDTGRPDPDSAAAANAPAAASSVLSASQPDAPDNIVAHEPIGYCGNTITTISRETQAGEEPWTACFWGEDSVALTDLLRYLNYSEEPCKCLPEYQVDTEFGTGYGLHLTEGYARYNGRQVTLKADQIALVQRIIVRQSEQASDGE